MQDIPANLYAILRNNGMTVQGECYANSCRAVLLKHFDFYVLGLADMPGEESLVRHAWVEHQGVSYDPTLQESGLHKLVGYKTLYRLNRNAIIQKIREHYGSEELARRNRENIGFDIPTLDMNEKIVIINT